MSTTIKAVCYMSKNLRNGEHPIMLRVCKDNKKKYISLGLSIKAEQWNFKTNSPKKSCANREKILIIINEKINELQRIALEKRVEGKDFTPTTLIESTTKTPQAQKTVDDFFQLYIQILKKENRIRYAKMFEMSYSSFIKFNKHLQIPFSDIDVAWLKRCESWMKRQQLCQSTISTKVRHLRVIFNYAIEENAIKPDCYPFKRYKISKLNTQTVKRAISKENVLEIMQCKGGSQMEQLSIDLFVFSYLAAGINFVDMALLEPSNIVGTQLIYYRHKTKKLIHVPLQAQAMAIIEKYQKGKSSYLFPILSSFHKTEIQKFDRLHKILAKVNKNLKRIGEKLNISLPLTTYVARHSYATVLKRSGVSTSIISESLGHSSERITQIYLDSFDNEQINDAMKNLL